MLDNFEDQENTFDENDDLNYNDNSQYNKIKLSVLKSDNGDKISDDLINEITNLFLEKVKINSDKINIDTNDYGYVESKVVDATIKTAIDVSKKYKFCIIGLTMIFEDIDADFYFKNGASCGIYCYYCASNIYDITIYNCDKLN